MIADLLPRFQEARRGEPDWTIERSIVIDGHEVALMRFRGTRADDSTYEGTDLKCECDFTEGVGWEQGDERSPNRNLDFECVRALAAQQLRYLELRQEYLDRYDPHRAHRGLNDGNFALIRNARAIVLDLVRRGSEGEWLGEKPGGASFYGGYFYMQTVAAIMGYGHGEGEVVDIIHSLADEKAISLEGAVVKSYREPPPPVDEQAADDLAANGYSLYGEFKKADLAVEAWMPARSGVRREWILRALRDGEQVHLRRVLMDYAPLFGPDVSDVARLEAATDELLEELA